MQQLVFQQLYAVLYCKHWSILSLEFKITLVIVWLWTFLCWYRDSWSNTRTWMATAVRISLWAVSGCESKRVQHLNDQSLRASKNRALCSVDLLKGRQIWNCTLQHSVSLLIQSYNFHNLAVKMNKKLKTETQGGDLLSHSGSLSLQRWHHLCCTVHLSVSVCLWEQYPQSSRVWIECLFQNSFISWINLYDTRSKLWSSEYVE